MQVYFINRTDATFRVRGLNCNKSLILYFLGQTFKTVATVSWIYLGQTFMPNASSIDFFSAMFCIDISLSNFFLEKMETYIIKDVLITNI